MFLGLAYTPDRTLQILYLASVTVIADLAAEIDVLVADVTACAKAVAAIGANIDIDASVKADLAVKVAAIVTVSA